MEDVVNKILCLARLGVYRSTIMQSGIAPQKTLIAAIAEAKKRGMYSVPDMAGHRGTYYQA